MTVTTKKEIMQANHYFSTPVYSIMKPEWLSNAIKSTDKFIDEAYKKEKPKLKIQPSCKLYLLKRKLPAHLTTAQSQQQSSELKKPSDQPASQEEYLQYLRFKNKMVADFEKEQKIKRILTQKRPPT